MIRDPRKQPTQFVVANNNSYYDGPQTTVLTASGALIISHKFLNALGSEFVCQVKAFPW